MTLSPSASRPSGMRDPGFLASSSSDELDSSPGKVEKSLTVRRGLDEDGVGLSVFGLLMATKTYA